MRKMLIALAAVAVLVAAADANANLILGSSFPSGPGQTVYVAPGVTFTAPTGYFEKKSVLDQVTNVNYTGVGIGGTTVPNQTGGEIDPLESIAATFAAPSRIDYFVLSFLYDGTEFSDFQEVATITANGGPTGQLRATFSVAGDQAQWSGTGFGSYTNMSPALGNRSGVWRVDNPFGDALVSGLVFGALNGTCGTQCCGAQCCSDQSDYSLERIAFTPVPEPGTLLLVGAGLAGLAARGRRRK